MKTLTPDDVALDLAVLADRDIAHLCLHLDQLPEEVRPIVRETARNRGLAASDEGSKLFSF